MIALRGQFGRRTNMDRWMLELGHTFVFAARCIVDQRFVDGLNRRRGIQIVKITRLRNKICTNFLPSLEAPWVTTF